MFIRSSHVGRNKRAQARAPIVSTIGTARLSKQRRHVKMGDVMMQAEARSARLGSVGAHPLAELLECPADAGNLLSSSAQSLEIPADEAVFRQDSICKGLYVVVSGLFVRKTERLNARLTLGPARAGDLVELAAALGDGHHTYTLTAQTGGSVLMLPIEALTKVFEKYPPLRMRLLEELAREVSRAYLSCCMSRTIHTRRKAGTPEIA